MKFFLYLHVIFMLAQRDSQIFIAGSEGQQKIEVLKIKPQLRDMYNLDLLQPITITKLIIL